MAGISYLNGKFLVEECMQVLLLFLCSSRSGVSFLGRLKGKIIVSLLRAREKSVSIRQKHASTDFDFTGAAKVLDPTRRVMRVVGAWPEKKLIDEFIFVFTVIYLIFHCILSFIEVAINIRDITYVVACGMEISFVLMALFKIIILQINTKSLTKFIHDMKEDFVAENYATNDEKMAFLSYNNLSRQFVKITLVSSYMASSSYYAMSLTVNVEHVIANSSYGYKLPYKVWNIIEPTNVIVYICLCAYQYFVVPCLIFGYVATDCFLVSLVLHVSGLFSALSCKVKHILGDPHDRQRHMKSLIVRHIRLIRLSQCLEDNFNLIILLQLMGSTSQLCLLGYDVLVSSVVGEAGLLVSFTVIVVCVFGILLAYCYIGECLIRESSLLGDSFYQCEWYNISKAEVKLMQICMMRSTKHMTLTSAKFCVLSLDTFSEVLKTSMAYFSVLRSCM